MLRKQDQCFLSCNETITSFSRIITAFIPLYFTSHNTCSSVSEINLEEQFWIFPNISLSIIHCIFSLDYKIPSTICLHFQFSALINQVNRHTPNYATWLQNCKIELQDLRWRCSVSATLCHIYMTKNAQNAASLSNLSIKGRVKRKAFQVFPPIIC